MFLLYWGLSKVGSGVVDILSADGSIFEKVYVIFMKGTIVFEMTVEFPWFQKGAGYVCKRYGSLIEIR